MSTKDKTENGKGNPGVSRQADRRELPSVKGILNQIDEAKIAQIEGLGFPMRGFLQLLSFQEAQIQDIRQNMPKVIVKRLEDKLEAQRQQMPQTTEQNAGAGQQQQGQGAGQMAEIIQVLNKLEGGGSSDGFADTFLKKLAMDSLLADVSLSRTLKNVLIARNSKGLILEVEENK